VAKLSTLVNEQLTKVEIKSIDARIAIEGFIEQMQVTKIPLQAEIANKDALVKELAEVGERVKAKSESRVKDINVQRNVDLIGDLNDKVQLLGRTSAFKDIADRLRFAAENGNLTSGVLQNIARDAKNAASQLQILGQPTDPLAQQFIGEQLLLAKSIVDSQTKEKTLTQSIRQNTADTVEPLTILRDRGIEYANALERGEASARAIQQFMQQQQLTGAQQVERATGRAHGGLMQFLASGGFARGTDRVPAMLTAGEFVVNKRSAGKFFSQLQAINAGVQPVYRNNGGGVSVTVGDINVQGGSSPRSTCRAIAQELAREIRRGAIRKF